MGWKPAQQLDRHDVSQQSQDPRENVLGQEERIRGVNNNKRRNALTV